MNTTPKQLRTCIQTNSSINSPNNSDIDNTKLRAVFAKNNLWPAYKNITVCFIGDSENIPLTDDWPINNEDPLHAELMNLLRQNPRKISVKTAIKEIVKKRIEPIVNLKFIFVEDPLQALVHITFKNNGSYSVIGYNGDNIIHEMNYGWFNVTVVLHEFGHLIGLHHEHQNPNGGIEWNKEAVYKMTNEMWGWPKEQAYNNIIKNLDKESINGSTFDPLSIMQYTYPPEWTINNIRSVLNGRFSGKDVLWISKTYPKQNEDPRVTAENFYQSTYGESLQSSIDKSERMVSTLYSTVPPVPTFPPVPIVTTVPPVPTFPPVPIVTTVPPVPIVKTVPNKSNSTIFIVFGIIFGLFIIWGVIAIIIKNKK